MAETGFIYALTDPRIDDAVLAVRYIGLTRQSLAQRLYEHLSEARRHGADTHRQRWIRQLLRLNILPHICEIRTAPIEDLAACERALIADYRRLGANLVNGTAGGEGVLALCEEARLKISRSKMGHRNNVGRKASPETCEKLRRAITGMKHTAQTRAKLSRVLAENTRAAGHVLSAEARARISEKKRGVPHIWTPEARQRARESALGRKASDEARAHLREAWLVRRARDTS